MNVRRIFLLACIGPGWLFLPGCDSEPPGDPEYSRDFKGDMKVLIRGISAYTRQSGPKFIVVPQNGHQLVTYDGKLGGYPDLEYLGAIHGLGREDLFYGYYGVDQETPVWIRNDIKFYLQKAMMYKKLILVTDYCHTTTKVNDSYTKNNNNDFISFASPGRELDLIPTFPDTAYNQHSGNVDSLVLARNFLLLKQPDAWDTRQEYLQALQSTSYDLIITDLFFDGTALTAEEVQGLKTKANGGKRLVLAWVNVGGAESSRYYWDPDWLTTPPEWLREEDHDSPGRYYVAYWMESWKNILCGYPGSYTSRVVEAGFDGILLDGADSFEYFESLER